MNSIATQTQVPINELLSELNLAVPLSAKIGIIFRVMESYPTLDGSDRILLKQNIMLQIKRLIDAGITTKMIGFRSKLNELFDQIDQITAQFDELKEKNQNLEEENAMLKEALKIQQGPEGEKEVKFIDWALRRLNYIYGIKREEFPASSRSL
ncbi:uncharacterized protein LOC128392429 [Panonychus citri]|uniref:uncharacterized protein LOC128392429 n=1 Tax=Panonychus citri TaxID=50023 RepID=UPI002307DC2A|nr:uncharacterized protein LOC128392429 [Panonychus citri]